MKNIALFFVFVFISVNSLFAEEAFANNFYHFCFCNEYYTIDSTTNIDSIVTIINQLPTNNVELLFDNVGEGSVDKVINLIKGKRFVVNVSFNKCNFKILPISIRRLTGLTGLHFYNCDSLVSLNSFNSTNTVFVLTFENCRIKELPKGTENFKSMLFLLLSFPNDFNEFDLNKELDKFSIRKNILNLYVKYKLLDIFPESLFKLRNLQSLLFFTDSSVYYPPRFDELINLIHIWTTNTSKEVYESLNKNPNLLYTCYESDDVFEDYYYLNEEEIKSFVAKPKTCFSTRATVLYQDEIEKVIINKYTFFYGKDYNYQSYRKIFAFDDNDIIFNIDTVNNNIRIEITNVKESDSVKLFVSKPNTDIPLYSYKYKREETIIDFYKLEGFNYFFITQINNKKLIIELYLEDNL